MMAVGSPSAGNKRAMSVILIAVMHMHLTWIFTALASASTETLAPQPILGFCESLSSRLQGCKCLMARQAMTRETH